MKDKDNITYKRVPFISILLNLVFCPSRRKRMTVSLCTEQKCWNCLSCGHVVIYRGN